VWVENSELEIELQSKNPTRVSSALQELKSRVDDFGGAPISFISANIFDQFDKPVIETDALNYLEILFSFPLFNTEPERKEFYHQGFNVLKITNSSHYAFSLAQNLKVEDSYAVTLTSIMNWIETSKLSDFTSLDVLERFLETLLDGRPELREPCINSIKNWERTELTEYLRRQLSIA
jgi:hypothetical protein